MEVGACNPCLDLQIPSSETEPQLPWGYSSVDPLNSYFLLGGRLNWWVTSSASLTRLNYSCSGCVGVGGHNVGDFDFDVGPRHRTSEVGDAVLGEEGAFFLESFPAASHIYHLVGADEKGVVRGVYTAVRGNSVLEVVENGHQAAVMVPGRNFDDDVMVAGAWDGRWLLVGMVFWFGMTDLNWVMLGALTWRGRRCCIDLHPNLTMLGAKEQTRLVCQTCFSSNEHSKKLLQKVTSCKWMVTNANNLPKTIYLSYVITKTKKTNYNNTSRFSFIL